MTAHGRIAAKGLGSKSQIPDKRVVPSLLPSGRDINGVLEQIVSVMRFCNS